MNDFNEFVKSLQRLYSTKILNTESVNKLFEDKKITAKERDYILK